MIVFKIVLFDLTRKNRVCLRASKVNLQTRSRIMCGSCHIRNVLIGVEYRNCRRTLDVYLLFAIWMGPIQSKLIYIFVTYGLATS